MEKSRIVPSDIFLKEARHIADKAVDKGIVLRVIGGVAIALHCSKYQKFARKLGRLGKDKNLATSTSWRTKNK